MYPTAPSFLSSSISELCLNTPVMANTASFSPSKETTALNLGDTASFFPSKETTALIHGDDVSFFLHKETTGITLGDDASFFRRGRVLEGACRRGPA